MNLSRRRLLQTGLAVALTPTLLRCQGSTGIELEGPRLVARPGTPRLDPPIGRSRLGLGRGRDGELYVPTTYAASAAAPLFVALHGAGGSGVDWVSYHARAEFRRMVLLAPDSRRRTWDRILGGYGPDVEFLNQALQYVFDRVRIDPTRVALGGFSDGASYSLTLGVSNGDLFTHLVAYSPGYYSPAEPIVGEPRIFVSHGTDDQILPSSLSRDEIVPRLEQEGYAVRYDEFAGGHEVPAAISESALDWFLSS